MSREDLVFTKKAIVVVAVISVLVSNIMIGFLGAMRFSHFSEEIKKSATEAATQAAVAGSEAAIRPFRDDQIRLGQKVENLEKRQDKFDDRLTVVERTKL
jgi:hypothetical protein